MLLHGFPLSSNTDPSALMGAYILACEGQQLPAMLAACRAYLQGKVKRDNHTFAPSAAEFAAEVRHQQMVMDAANRPRIEKPKEVEFSEEHRERMQGKLVVLSKALAGEKQAQEELQSMVSIPLEFVERKPLEDMH